MADKKVQKALSPEETTVLGNVKSLIDQLMAGGTDGEVAMASAPPTPDSEEEEPPMVAKANEGPTANPEDKAESRVEDPTDITAANLSEVGKSLAKLVALVESRQPVRKSVAQAPRQTGEASMNNMVMKSLADISTAMKTIADRQNQTETALMNILDGFGVVETVQKSATTKNPAPVQNMDGNMILSELSKVIKSMNGNQVQQENPWVRKSSNHEQLASALPMIFNQ